MDHASSPVKSVLSELGKHFPFEEAPVETDPELEVLIRRLATEMGVPADFAVAVARAESKLNPRAVSQTGYSGLFQIGAAAIADVGASGFHVPAPNGDVLDPDWNARVGLTYLHIVARRIEADISDRRDWPKVYAAFNLGSGNYSKLIAGKFNDPDLRRAVRNQEQGLSAGGPERYLASVPHYLGIA